MRTYAALALAALIAVALSLPASGRLLSRVDHKQYFVIANNTTAPASLTDANGNEIDCSSTLEARCIGGTSWRVVEDRTVALTCPRTEPGVEYREPGFDILENTAWSCSPMAADAPANAISAIQLVRVSGTLSSCEASELTAQSSCTYSCADDDDEATVC